MVINYNVNFNPPLPFTLESERGDINVLSHDTLEVDISGSGNLPDSITFHWIENNIKNKENINHKNQIYKFQFNAIKSDIIYWANYQSNNFFSFGEQANDNIVMNRISRIV